MSAPYPPLPPVYLLPRPLRPRYRPLGIFLLVLFGVLLAVAGWMELWSGTACLSHNAQGYCTDVVTGYPYGTDAEIVLAISAVALVLGVVFVVWIPVPRAPKHP